MLERRRAALVFGSEIWLKSDEEVGYIASPGSADPRLFVREGSTVSELLGFESSVFVLQRPFDQDLQAHGVVEITYGAKFALKHKQSGMFVSLLPTQPSAMDNNCHTLTLVPDTELNAWNYFRIIPRYKVLSEGDYVCHEDEILIQLFDRPLFFHTSEAGKPVTDVTLTSSAVDENVIEVNGSESESSWIIGKFNWGADDPEYMRTLKSSKTPIFAGSPVAMFHREKEALMISTVTKPRVSMAKGKGSVQKIPARRKRGQSFTIDFYSSTISDMRQGKIDLPQPLFIVSEELQLEDICFSELSCSCSALWIFECQNPVEGGPLRYGDPYRVRQAATNLYLAVSPREGLDQPAFGKTHSFYNTLKADQAELVLIPAPKSDEDLHRTLFTVQPMFLTECPFATEQDFMRIQNFGTSLWLSTESGKSPTPNIRLKLEPKPTSHDALLAGHVKEQMQRDVLFLFYNGEFLRSYRDAFEDPETTTFSPEHFDVVIKCATEALTCLIKFCTESDDSNPLTREGLPIVDHQRMMFDLQFQRIVFDVLVAPFVGDRESHLPELPFTGGLIDILDLHQLPFSAVHHVCRLCYRLLKQMIKGNPRFAVMLVDYIPYMHYQDGMRLHVADTMLELFSDNALLPRQVYRSATEHYIHRLQAMQRSGGYIKFLSVMCCVEDQGIEENQKLVCKMLLEDSPQVLLETVLTSTGTVGVVPKKGTPAVPIEEFVTSYHDAKLAKFFEGQIALLDKLCLGSNAYCLSVVEQFVPSVQMISIVKTILGTENEAETSRLDSLRASLYNLALNLFVVRELSDPEIQRKASTILLGGSSLRHSESSLSGRPDSSLVKNLKIVSTKFLKQNGSLIAENKERNILINTVVDMWRVFFKFSQYSDDEAKEILPILLEILKHENDVKSRKKIRISGHTVATVEQWNRFAPTEENNLIMAIKRTVCSAIALLLHHSIRNSASKIIGQVAALFAEIRTSSESPRRRKTIIGSDKQSIKSKTLKLIEEERQILRQHFSPRELIPLLIDTARYESNDLASGSMNLLVDLCNLRQTMLSMLHSVDLAPNEEHVKTFDSLYNVAVELYLAMVSKDSDDLPDAIEIVLSTLLGDEGEVLRRAERQLPVKAEPHSPLRSSVKFADEVENESGDLKRSSESSGSMRRVSLSWWGHARAVTKVLALGKKASEAVKEKNNYESAALEQEQERARSIVMKRAEMMRHWGIHTTLLAALQILEPSHPSYSQIMEFFYYFSMSPSNAQALSGNLSQFVQGIAHSNAHSHCMHITISIMTHCREVGDTLDKNMLNKLVELIGVESNSWQPNISFIRLVNRAIIGHHMIPSNQRFLLSSLQQKGVFSNILEVLPTWNSERLRFNTALVMLLCNCCTTNPAVRHLVSRIIPATAVFNILLRHEKGEELRYCHQVPYYRLLGAVFFVSDIDDLQTDKSRLRAQWMGSVHWWQLVETKIIPAIHKIIQVLESPNLDEIENQLFADREFYFHALFPTLANFFTECFSPAFAQTNDAMLTTTMQLAKSYARFFELVATKIGPLSPEESSTFWRLLRVLRVVSDDTEMKGDVMEAISAAERAGSQLRQAVKQSQSQVTQEGDDSEEAESSADISPSEQLFQELSAVDEAVPAASDAPLRAIVSILSDSGGTIDIGEFISKVLSHLKQALFAPTTIVGLLRIFKYCLDEHANDDEAMYKFQLFFDKLGMMRVVTTLTEVTEDSVVRAAVELGISLLEGGNKEVQDSMLLYFDTHDERFFHNIRDIILNCAVHTRRRNVEIQQHALVHQQTFTKNSDTRSEMSSEVILQSKYSFMQQIFRLLQLMCEGHHFGMQNYIREQSDNLHSINIVKEVLGLMKDAGVLLDEISVPLMCQGFALLTEFCQGPCPKNQMTLINNNVCGLIAAAFECQLDTVEEVSAMKANAATTLLSLLEGCNDALVYSKIVQQIPPAAISHHIQALAQPLGDRLEREEEDRIDVLFNLIIFLHQTKPHAPEDISNEIGAVLTRFDYLSKLLGCIEIQRGEQLENVFFRIPFICLSLTHKSKETLLWTVDRSTRSTKLSDFFYKSDELIFEMDSSHRFQEMLEKYTRFSSNAHFLKRLWNTRIAPLFFNDRMDYYENLSLIVALTINLLFVATDSAVDNQPLTSTLAERLVDVLSLVQLFLCCLLVAIDSFVYLPVYLYSVAKAEQRVRKQRAGDKNFAKEDAEDAAEQWSNMKLAAQILTRFQSVFRGGMVLIALLGIFVTPYIFSFHLVGLVTKSSVLKNVIVAITQNGKSLVLTMGLGMMLVYVFSIIGFSYFRGSFGTVVDGDPDEDNCSSLFRCFLHILIHGLRQGGGVGDIMEPAKWGSADHSGRMIFDFVFFALLNIVFLNILFGIIIDTFAELRDDKRKREEDMHSTCFICGVDADTFDNEGGGFTRHVKQEHNMWQYLYFMHHLRKKDQNEFTGQESYVFSKIKVHDLTFFPQGRCLSLRSAAVHELREGSDEKVVGGKGAVDGVAAGPLESAAVASEEKRVKDSRKQPAPHPQSSGSCNALGALTGAEELESLQQCAAMMREAVQELNQLKTTLSTADKGPPSGSFAMNSKVKSLPGTQIFRQHGLEHSSPLYRAESPVEEAQQDFTRSPTTVSHALEREVERLQSELEAERRRRCYLQQDDVLLRQQLLEVREEARNYEEQMAEMAREHEEEMGRLIRRVAEGNYTTSNPTSPLYGTSVFGKEMLSCSTTVVSAAADEQTPKKRRPSSSVGTDSEVDVLWERNRWRAHFAIMKATATAALQERDAAQLEIKKLEEMCRGAERELDHAGEALLVKCKECAALQHQIEVFEEFMSHNIVTELDGMIRSIIAVREGGGSDEAARRQK